GGAIDPALGATGRFSVSFTWPRRAAILAAAGTPIAPCEVPAGEGGHCHPGRSLVWTAAAGYRKCGMICWVNTFM
ncbi:MAG: hypothetical protein ABSE20_20135, partial [Acetobacteraceae bacterium]